MRVGWDSDDYIFFVFFVFALQVLHFVCSIKE